MSIEFLGNQPATLCQKYPAVFHRECVADARNCVIFFQFNPPHTGNRPSETVRTGGFLPEIGHFARFPSSEALLFWVALLLLFLTVCAILCFAVLYNQITPNEALRIFCERLEAEGSLENLIQLSAEGARFLFCKS